MASSHEVTLNQNWEVESIRVSTFHNITLNLASGIADLWRQATGGLPEQVAERPAQNTTIAEGSYHGGRLAMVCSPNRVDWHMRATPAPPGAPLKDLNTVGTLSDLRPVAEELANGWLKAGPDVTRLAFGLALVIPSTGLSDAYGKLSSMLSDINFDLSGATDFLYQINRRRPSQQSGGIVINRISRWSVSQSNTVEFAVDAVGNAAPATRVSDVQFASRLELDINTVGRSPSAISKDRATKLFNELIQSGIEIAEKGDIK